METSHTLSNVIRNRFAIETWDVSLQPSAE